MRSAYLKGERMKRNKAELFIKLAEARTRKATETIRLIGNLSNKANYEYTDEMVKKIFNHLQAQLDGAKRRFELMILDRKPFSLSDKDEALYETKYSNIRLPLPDGAELRAKAIDDPYYPAIKVELLKDDKIDVVCEVEYNPDNDSPRDIGTCLYAEGLEDSVKYFPFRKRKEDEKDDA